MHCPKPWFLCLWNGPNKPILQRCREDWKWCLKALRITPGTCEHCINICYSILIQFQNKLSGFQNCTKSYKNRKLESMQALTGILLFPSSFWKMVGKWASWKSNLFHRWHKEWVLLECDMGCIIVSLHLATTIFSRFFKK